MPSLVVLQSARNEMFDFLVDEAARSFVHFVTHYGNASSHCFCKRQSAVFALTGYAKPTCAMLRLFFSGCLLVSGRGVSRNQSFRDPPNDRKSNEAHTNLSFGRKYVSRVTSKILLQSKRV